MWIKAEYKLLSPVVLSISPSQSKGHKAFPIMADGALAFYSFANRNGFAPDINEVYNEELPFCKTEFNGDFFYNIGSFIFEKPYYSTTALTRKLPGMDTDILDKLKIQSIQANKGVFKMLRVNDIKLINSKTKTVYFYAEIDDNRTENAISVLQSIKAIGKRANSGFGSLEYFHASRVDDDNIEGFFIKEKDNKFLYRPIPIELLDDNDYEHAYMGHLRPPHHKNIYNKKEVVYGFRKNVHEI